LVLLRYMEDKTTVAVITHYKQQLTSAMDGCPAVQRQAGAVAFSGTSLQQLVASYNECIGGISGKKSLPAKQSISRLTWGALAGVTKTSLNLNLDGYVPDPLTGGVKPAAGIWADVSFPRNRGQWGVYADVHYQAYNVSGTAPKIANGLVGANLSYVKVATALRWQAPGTLTVRPYLLLGVTNGFGLTTESSLWFAERGYEQGLFGGAGIRLNRWFVDMRYELGNGISDTEGFTTSTATVGVFAGIRF
jgi:hypothetical protein